MRTKSKELPVVRGFTADQEEKFVRSCYENFPEYAQYAFRCEDWHYKPFIFKFVDTETGKKYTIDLGDALVGFRLFVKAMDENKLPGLGLSAGYLDPEDGPGEIDAYALDAMLQFAILGEVIYG